MFLILTASSDAYITNKIINNDFKATDANTGKAATVDIFKLWQESTFISGSTRISSSVQELSRGFVKFEYDRLRELTSSILDISDPSFRCYLRMYDVMGGQATPTNFNLVLFPMSRSFDEGLGRDVVSFSDLDSCNFVTASYSSGSPSLWFHSGANASGSMGDTGIDILERGTLDLDTGEQTLFKQQNFLNGGEDLMMDITNIVSATMSGDLSNHGFRLSLTSSEEYDHKSYFVKRFGTRHNSNPFLRPRIEVSFDDSILDHHQNFYFDLTGSLFLQNYHRGQQADILSGSSLDRLTGLDCMRLEVRSGSFVTSSIVNQHTASTNTSGVGGITTGVGDGIQGLYSASFCIPFSSGGLVYSDPYVTNSINTFAIKSGSITFDTYWQSLDGTVTFHTGSLEVKTISRSAFNVTQQRLMFTVTNSRTAYKRADRVKFRIFVNDLTAERQAAKLPYSLKSVVLEEVYYRIKQLDGGKIVIPFQKDNNGTRVSTDSDGMYFEMFMEDLPIGKNYTVELLVDDKGIEYIEQAKNVRFRVDP